MNIVRGRHGWMLWASLLALLVPGSGIGRVPAPALQPTHPPGAAIASPHALATEAGLQVLRAGGNAFDAAVAVSSTLSVVEPISSGLGGGGFFLLHDGKTGKDIFIDARETSPESATPAVYLDRHGDLDTNRSENGPWSAGIPGLPAALVELSRKYGKLPLKTTLATAIRIASEGFPVYARLEKGYGERRAVMERYPGTRAVYLADGDPPKVGETFKQPDLARTLEVLAEKGSDGFYRGDVAKKLLASVRAEGGKWTAEELANYKVREREPLRFQYHDWKITTAPPPSSGGVAIAPFILVIRISCRCQYGA
jgi:gamma-glutamyltranspeptidase/glutathione hydrolase